MCSPNGTMGSNNAKTHTRKVVFFRTLILGIMFVTKLDYLIQINPCICKTNIDVSVLVKNHSD